MWLYKATWPAGLIFVIVAAVIHTSSPALIKKANKRVQVEQAKSKGVAGDAKRTAIRHDVWRGRQSSKSQLAPPVSVFNSTSDNVVSFVEPRIDAEIVFPQLDFNNTSYENGSFWSPNMEKRFLRYQRQRRPLQVFVIPHSHQDPGWLQTFDSYYLRHTKSTLDNIVSKMTQYRNMTFVWSEIAFLAKWWESAATSNQKDKFKSLIEEGRLEIGTGGWVMADEATVNLYSLVDQMIEGHQWMKGNLNLSPTTSWSIDPFGHSGVLPLILKKTGVDSMVIQRVHYGWKKWFANNQAGDFKWIQRWDTSGEDTVLCHNNPYDLYSIKHSCGPYKDICLQYDFRDISGEKAESCGKAVPIDDSNVQEKAELLLEQYQRTASMYPHNIAMILRRDDLIMTKAISSDSRLYS